MGRFFKMHSCKFDLMASDFEENARNQKLQVRFHVLRLIELPTEINLL